jgi:hypothetical protein
MSQLNESLMEDAALGGDPKRIALIAADLAL